MTSYAVKRARRKAQEARDWLRNANLRSVADVSQRSVVATEETSQPIR